LLAAVLMAAGGVWASGLSWAEKPSYLANPGPVPATDGEGDPWARPVGRPLVFKWRSTHQTALRFALVVRTDRPAKGIDSLLNGYATEGGGSSNILVHPGDRQCSLAPAWALVVKGPNGGQTFNMNRLNGVKPGDKVNVELQLGADTVVFPEDLGPVYTFKDVRVHGISGSLKDIWEQPTLQNKAPQKVLKTIGCAGKLRSGYAKYL
jgi:hypothetical protein